MADRTDKFIDEFQDLLSKHKVAKCLLSSDAEGNSFHCLAGVELGADGILILVPDHGTIELPGVS